MNGMKTIALEGGDSDCMMLFRWVCFASGAVAGLEDTKTFYWYRTKISAN